jgi:hypothetical protein
VLHIKTVRLENWNVGRRDIHHSVRELTSVIPVIFGTIGRCPSQSRRPNWILFGEGWSSGLCFESEIFQDQEVDEDSNEILNESGAKISLDTDAKGKYAGLGKPKMHVQ